MSADNKTWKQRALDAERTLSAIRTKAFMDAALASVRDTHVPLKVRTGRMLHAMADLVEAPVSSQVLLDALDEFNKVMASPVPEIPSGDLTVEQAQAYERSQWWKGKPAHEIVLVQLQLDRICMPFGEFRTLADRATGQMLCDSAFATEESRRSLVLAIQEQRAATLTAVTIALCEHWDGKCDPRSLVELLADPYDLSVPEIDEICERLKVIANAVALADVQSTQTSKEPS